MDTGSPESKFGVSLDDAPALLERIAAVPGARAARPARAHRVAAARPRRLRRARPRRSPRSAASRSTTSAAASASPTARTSRRRSIADYAAGDRRGARTHLDPGARLIVEPGRSVVGRSGVTLYSVVTVKRGARTHVAVDGGMADNLEHVLNSIALATRRSVTEPATAGTASGDVRGAGAKTQLHGPRCRDVAPSPVIPGRYSPTNPMSTSIRRASTSIERIASRTIGMSSSPPSVRRPRAPRTRAARPSAARRRPRASPSTTMQPSRSGAQYSSSSSAGASPGHRAAARRAAPRRPRAPACPSSRTIGRSSVPARRSIVARRAVHGHRAAERQQPRAGRVTWNEPSSPCGRPTRPAVDELTRRCRRGRAGCP